VNHHTANLLECLTHRIEDRKSIARRVLDALLADPDARMDFRTPWRPLTVEEEANWISREHFASLLHSFPEPTLLVIDSSIPALGT
jgi:hypothetical protein